MLKTVNETNVDEINSGTNLVKLSTPWCVPCKKLDPIIDEFSNNNPSMNIYKADIEEMPDLADKYNVMSVPTLLILSDGEILDKHVGGCSKEEFEKFVESYI